MNDPESSDPKLPRREVLKLAAAAAVGFLARDVAAATPASRAALPPLPVNPATPNAMPTRNLGRTGYQTGLFSLGGQAAIEKANNEAVAVPLIERALDLGVNYIDTSAIYGGDERWSERYIGRVMKTRRREAFLATKTHERTYDGSMRLLERSLELLQTDHIDLWQIHNLSELSQVDRIFAKGGAVEALIKAVEQKIVRTIGVTGHADPAVLLEVIRRHRFDTILLALNAADAHHLSFSKALLPLAVEKQMGIIGMKIPARGRILTGYEPSRAGTRGFGPAATRSGTLTMTEAMRYVLSQPVSTVIIGCDSIAQLEENVKIARAFTPLSDSQMASLTAKAEPVSKQSLFFRKWEA
ncbi:MAG: aldo/keto reductase [Acidobacteria bacterium]|nr:aldo/keto reductase [Acidobacteriota bacterium]